MISEIIYQQLQFFLPEIVLVGTFCVILLAGLIAPKKASLLAWITIIGLALSFVFVLRQFGHDESLFSGMIALDPFAVFFKIFSIVCVVCIILFSQFSNEVLQTVKRISEYYALLVAMTLGMFLMASATHLLMMVLAMELTSLSAYVLAGYTKEALDSSEASLKYIIYGAVSTGIMIYGISFLFGLTGALQYHTLSYVLSTTAISPLPLAFVIILMLVGFGYKISAVPFHFWTPDVYEGAPITITALLSVASKAAGFAMLIRFFVTVFVDPFSSLLAGKWMSLSHVDWQLLIAILSALTMTIGNLVAIWQDNLKRLLAYSSIAHAGYMLMGVAVLTDKGIAAVLIYFVMYLFMNLGAFLVVMLVANKTGSEDIDTYKGLGYQSPFLATSMAIFLISLTGIPPTAGFIGKLYLFAAVIDARWFWLAIVGVLNSVISLYYYARVFRNMFLRTAEQNTSRISLGKMEIVILLAFVIPTLVLGLYFSPIVSIAQTSLTMLGVR